MSLKAIFHQYVHCSVKKTFFLKVNYNKQYLSSLVGMSIRHHFLRKGLKKIAINLHTQQKSNENYIFYETSNIIYCEKLKEKVQKPISVFMKIATIFVTVPVPLPPSPRNLDISQVIAAESLTLHFACNQTRTENFYGQRNSINTKLCALLPWVSFVYQYGFLLTAK